MPLCPFCMLQISVNTEMCPHHISAQDSNWAKTNRIMCDLIHRGIAPPRLSEKERNDDFIVIDNWGA